MMPVSSKRCRGNGTTVLRRLVSAATFACGVCQSSTGSSSISSVSLSSTELSLGDSFTVKWGYSAGDAAEQPATTGDLNTFDIDLEHCVDGAGTCKCSGGTGGQSSLVSLCPEATGCVDSDGSYDLVLPSSEPTTVFVGGVYQVRVSLATEPTVAACTAGFEVLESDDEPGLSTSSGESNSNASAELASLTVIAPSVDIVPGQAFTAQWIYEDGEGDGEEVDGEEGFVGAAGSFAVDLYSCADGACEDGSCGTFVASLCDEDGCSDPGTGDFDVVIPAGVTPGAFSLYVEEMSEGGPWDCTSFDVSTDATVSGAVSTPAPASPTVAPSAAAVSPKTSAPSSPMLTLAPLPAPTASPVLAPSAAPSSAGTVSSGSDPVSAWEYPETVPSKQVCDSAAALTFTYEEEEGVVVEDEGGPLVTIAHTSGDRAEAGCATMTKLWTWLQTGPTGVPEGLLYPVNPETGVAITTAVTSAELTGVWLLKTSILVTNGVALDIKGAAASGDCDELKMSSTATQIHYITGYGGNIDIMQTTIQSWDESIPGPHVLGVGSDGDEARSYISCISEVVYEPDTCPEGAASKDMGECRMDMADSELGYLGYFNTEAYGITWKVRGFCYDKSNLDVFERVNVYGDITNCNIHHMWYGMYSYGHMGGVWTDSLVHDNHVYGFDPHDDSDYLTIRNNTVYNNGKHGIIASKRCDHVSITNNKVDNSGGSGIMLHMSCDDSEVIGNVVHVSGSAGVSVVETSRVIVRDNVFADGVYGSRFTMGASDNLIYQNVYNNNSRADIYSYLGGDEPTVAPYTGVCTNNTYDSNEINYVASGVIDLESTETTIISNNIFNGEGGYFGFEYAEDTSIVGNTGDIVLTGDHRVLDSCFTAETPIEPTCA